MEPRLKVGDTVYIKQLSELEFRPPFGISEQMYCYSGKKAKITAVDTDKYDRYERIAGDIIPKSMLDGAKYTLDIDDGRWRWSLPMLSTVEEGVIKKSKEGKESPAITINIKRKLIHFNFSN